MLRKTGILSTSADQSLIKLIIYLLAPCLIFDSIIGNRALDEFKNVLMAPVVGFVTVTLGVMLGYLAGPLAKVYGKKERGTFAASVGVYNYGYIPIPLALALFSRETVGVLFVHNMGVEIALWTIALIFMSGASFRSGLRKIINPPLVATLSSLLLNSVDADEWLPRFVLSTAEMLGQCAIPLGVIIIGATAADLFHQLNIRKHYGAIIAACLLRILILPALFLLLAKFIPASIELKQVIILQAAMPSAVFPIVISRFYGGDPATAMKVVFSTSALSIITIPLWIKVGIGFLGL